MRQSFLPISVALDPGVLGLEQELGVNGGEELDYISLGLFVLRRRVYAVAMLHHAHVVAVLKKRCFLVYRWSHRRCLENEGAAKSAQKFSSIVVGR